MYEDDTPPAERRAQALSLDRDLLRELLGQEELRELLDRGRDRRGRAVSCSRRPANADELHDLLRVRGDRFARRLRRGLRRDAARASGARSGSGSPGEERLVAAEDAGRYRDALGVMPPGGLPGCLPRGRQESLRQLVLRFARGRGPVHDRRGGGATSASTLEQLLHELERDGSARARRAPPRRDRARVVRPGRAAPAAPRVARGAAEGGRAGRAGRARALPAGLARDRPAREPARGARAAAGAAAAGVAVGGRGAAAPRAQLPAGLARRALRLAARSSGSAPVSTASPSTSARTRRCSAGRPAHRRPRARRRTRSARALSASAEFWYPLVEAAGLEPEVALPALWELVWAGEVTNDAWTPLRAGRRYAAPSNRLSQGRAASRARARPQSRRRRVAGRSPIASSPGRPTGARSPSSCSSGRASSPATASAARASPAATAPSTAS